MFTVSFFGHRYVEDYLNLESKLEQLMTDILIRESNVQFLVGRNGEFDKTVASVYKRVTKKLSLGNSCLVLVLPYMTKELRDNRESFEEYFDCIEICEKSENAHYKNAIQLRNRDMVDRSDLTVFYINKNSGGAYKTYCYAQREGKKIINLAELI